MIVVNANLSREVYEYFDGYDLSLVADKLMDMYDFTNLPQISSERYKECKIEVTNELYISLYNTLGPRSKKLSLGRLFEFAYNTDVLALPRFQEMKLEKTKRNPALAHLDRAYKALLDARKHDKSDILETICGAVRTYRNRVALEENKDDV